MQRLLKFTNVNSPNTNRRGAGTRNLQLGQSMDTPDPDDKLSKLTLSPDQSSPKTSITSSQCPSSSLTNKANASSTPSLGPMSPSAEAPTNTPTSSTPARNRRRAFFQANRFSLDECGSNSKLDLDNSLDPVSPRINYSQSPFATPPLHHRRAGVHMTNSPIRLLHPKAAFAIAGFGMLNQPKSNIDFGDLEYMNTSNEGYRLTPEHRSLVRQAWRSYNGDGMEAGVWIFKRIFAHYPHLKRLFNLHLLEDETQLDADPQFQKHARVFTNVLEMVVECVDALDDSLGPLLLSYGSRHVRFESDHGFRSEYWDAFAVAMIEYASNNWKFLKNTSRKTEALKAWRILVFFIVSKVKQGFMLEKKALENKTNAKDTCGKNRKLST